MKCRAMAKASVAERARAKDIELLDLVTVEFRGWTTSNHVKHRAYFGPSMVVQLSIDSPIVL